MHAVRSDREYVIACIDKIEQEESKQQNDAHLQHHYSETRVIHGWSTETTVVTSTTADE